MSSTTASSFTRRAYDFTLNRLFAGDTMHSPVQAMRPHWSSGFCTDPVQSAQTRRKLIEYCVDKNALLMPAHFPPPHGVRVRAQGEHFTVIPE